MVGSSAGDPGIGHSRDQPEQVALPRYEAERRQYTEEHGAIEDDHAYGNHDGREAALIESTGNEVAKVAKCQAAGADMNSGPSHQPDGEASERYDEYGGPQQLLTSAQRNEDSENQQGPGVGEHMAEPLMEKHMERNASQTVDVSGDYAEPPEVQTKHYVQDRHDPN